jgi:hypothetical protein
MRVVLLATYCPSNAICSYESIEGNDETLWKENPYFFKAWRKPDMHKRIH